MGPTPSESRALTSSRTPPILGTGSEIMRFLLLRSSNDIQNEMMFRPQHDPHKPPPAEPGDAAIFIAMGAGAVLGGAIGIIVSLRSDRSFFVPMSIGSVAGGLAGTFVGDWIKKHFRNKNPPGPA